MLSVVVLGKTRLATTLCEWLVHSRDYELIGVVPTRPQPNWCEDLGAWASANGISSAKDGRLSGLAPHTADLAISCYYDRILRRSDLDSYGLCLNVHNSLLPRHRGVGPIEWSMRDGSGVQGVTVHEIESGIDTGPIYGQVSFMLWPHMKAEEIHALCLDYATPLLISVLQNISHLSPVRQSEHSASYHTRHETEIMLNKGQPGHAQF